MTNTKTDPTRADETAALLRRYADDLDAGRNPMAIAVVLYDYTGNGISLLRLQEHPQILLMVQEKLAILVQNIADTCKRNADHERRQAMQ